MCVCTRTVVMIPERLETEKNTRYIHIKYDTKRYKQLRLESTNIKIYYMYFNLPHHHLPCLTFSICVRKLVL